MGALLLAIVRRDLLLAWRRRTDVATVVLFFLIGETVLIRTEE